MNIKSRLQSFLASETAAGQWLIVAALCSLLLSQTPLGPAYVTLWHHPVWGVSLHHAINDGLMTLFFLLVGLELRFETQTGLLAQPGQFWLPAMGALGGMLVPGALYLWAAQSTPLAGGFGVPMATDIAFALAVLSLFGSRIPLSVKLFLTALAVMDDLGAVLLIALAYAHSLQWPFIVASFAVIIGMAWWGKKMKCPAWVYVLTGLIAWGLMLPSGIHATLAGVCWALVVPGAPQLSSSMARRWHHALEKPVAWIVLPIFALANTALLFSDVDMHSVAFATLPWAIGLALVIGKPVGIYSAVWITHRLYAIPFPKKMQQSHVLLVGLLGGIGFTMSVFMCQLAFVDANAIQVGIWSVVGASCVAALLALGYGVVLTRKR